MRSAAGRRHHHALSHGLTRTDWFGWGLKPYLYVMPVIKTEADRQALRHAATSGEACYFLGTDSAPHPMAKKLSVNGIPGIFNAPVPGGLCQGFRGGGRARQARGLRLVERARALRPAAERGHHHAGEEALDADGGNSGAGAGREGACAPRWGAIGVAGHKLVEGIPLTHFTKRLQCSV